MDLNSEIRKRKTFGIISHPDAGKTTLTEKLLLFGGAIQAAGTVKRHRGELTAVSDFMEIEKQRGISVSTSVMGFHYKGYQINILDTPGHKDFAEDTYRTLSAVDSVILVIDCVKGVEEQTERLMKVCRMRAIPVIIFINKMDREGQNPFELLEEIEDKLNISTSPLTWPIGIGMSFKGVYNILNRSLNLYSPNKSKKADDYMQIRDIRGTQMPDLVGDRNAKNLLEDIEVVSEGYEPFDNGLYRTGYLAPVFFGSAINNFGVQELLETFIAIAPGPQARETTTRIVEPDEAAFTGFIFKIHANLDPRHRDRIAFCRICSGKFLRNTFYRHTRLDKKLRFSAPTAFMASEKSIVEEAFPGDVIGLYDAGNFKIGDTITSGEKIQFKGIPNFSPEIFCELENRNPLKSKQLERGIDQLTDEGIAQLFFLDDQKIIGVVGELQLEVIRFRLLNEYGAECTFRPRTFSSANWLDMTDYTVLKKFTHINRHNIGYDKESRPVFLANSNWDLDQARKNYPSLGFYESSEWDR
ncbi:peptide chain release factor 3 [Sphingobacterium multivorum]